NARLYPPRQLRRKQNDGHLQPPHRPALDHGACTACPRVRARSASCVFLAQLCVGDHVRRIALDKNLSLEIDPNRITNPKALEKNKILLEELSDRIFQSVMSKVQL